MCVALYVPVYSELRGINNVSVRCAVLTKRPSSLCPYSKHALSNACLRQLSDTVLYNLCTTLQIIEQLSAAGVSGEVCKVIGECVSVRSEEVRTQLLRDTAKVSPSSLSDFDWKLKVSRSFL